MIPNSKLVDYLSILKFLFVKEDNTVFDVVGKSEIYKTFWEPLTIGVLNTDPRNASAKVLSNVLKKTFFKGEKYCWIIQPKINWNDSLIKPSIDLIEKKGNEIKFNCLLRKVIINKNKITKLIFNDNEINVNERDKIIFSLPPSNVNKLLPDIYLPKEYNTILNVHFTVSKQNLDVFKMPILGFINSISDWLFIKHNHISVTVSNANSFNSTDSDTIANSIWREISSYTNENIKFQNFQVVREKKATYHQSIENLKIIKAIKQIPENLSLAGDWTQYNLPCTIEASILSGKKAVEFF